MKKLIALFMLSGILMFPVTTKAQVADQDAADDTTEVVEQAAPTPAAPVVVDDEIIEEDKGFHQVIKEKFIEGDPTYMSPVLICLILGLAVAIERIITLNLSTTNTKKLLARVEEALEQGGIEAAKDVTKNTKGPVASIFTQGLMRYSEGIEMVEKSIIAYGSVEMGRLEKGLVWISLFISLAPMLGFMGTVIGMIGAFDAIEAAGDISPSLVAGGIKIALLTTVAGLIVAIILQLFYNYCVSKIDSLVNDMEDASISLVDILVKHKLTK
ncbi:MotA/TolQ/ExbB proton channel family protein [Aquiflexum sp.]|uniref:MotA/TolQ/ExbB proton channel family protein n=1 Tax=Aquiflexum sp. TaxID=1872584 RepID=UPI003593317D